MIYSNIISKYTFKTLKYFSILMFLFVLSCNNKEFEPNVIDFWHFQSEPNQKKVLDEILNKFEKRYKCKVRTTELSWKDGKIKLFAAFNANIEPDVVELGSDWVAQFSSSKVLKELNRNEVNFDNFVEFSQGPCLYNNKIYALPWYVDTRVLFYNKSLLNSINLSVDSVQTFEDLLTASKAMKAKGINGFGVNGPDAHRLYKKIVTFLWSYGGDLIDNNGNFVLNSPQNKLAVSKYKEFMKYGKLENQRNLDNEFIQGKLGFLISGAWLIEKIKNENPNLEYGVVTLPKVIYGDFEQKGISFAGGEYLAVTRAGKKKKLSEELIKYLTSGEVAIDFCKKIPEAGFPADKKYFNDDFYMNQPIRKVFADQLNYAKMTPVHKDWLDLEVILEGAIEEVLYSRKTVSQSLNDLQAKAQKKFNNKK